MEWCAPDAAVDAALEGVARQQGATATYVTARRPMAFTAITFSRWQKPSGRSAPTRFSAC